MSESTAEVCYDFPPEKCFRDRPRPLRTLHVRLLLDSRLLCLVNSVPAVKLRVSLSEQSLIYRSSVLTFGLLDPALNPAVALSTKCFIVSALSL